MNPKRAKLPTTNKIRYRRIVEIYNRASEETRILGRKWYSDKGDILLDHAKDLGINPCVFTGIVSALSPQTKWEVNISEARKYVKDPNYRPVAYPIHRMKAEEIRNGGDPIEVLGPKTQRFYLNLTGFDRNAVTIDGHILQVLLGIRTKLTAKDLKITPKVYRRIERNLQRIARYLGEIPSELQAIVWIQKRKEDNNATGLD